MKLNLCSLILATTLLGAIPHSAVSAEKDLDGEDTVLENEKTLKPYDRTFIDEMTEHHKEGVMMAEIAVRKAHHPELMKMAKMMLSAQSEEIRTMQTWRKSWYPQASEFRSHSVGMKMEKLEDLSGEEFDIAFLDSMIMHHPGAIYLGHEAQSRGHHRNLINLAKKISTDQIKELNQLRTWRFHWTNHDSEN